MRKPIVGALLLVAGALLALMGFILHWGGLSSALIAVPNVLWSLVSWPIAAYEAWRDERTARIAAESSLQAAFNPPPVSGKVLRFEGLDYADFTEKQFKIAEKEMMSEVLGPEPFTYLAHIQIQNPGPPTRAQDWKFSVALNDGRVVDCRFVAKDWDAPARWPKHTYHSLHHIESKFLQTWEVYNVLVHVKLAYGKDKVKMESFEARFTDSNERTIACRI